MSFFIKRKKYINISKSNYQSYRFYSFFSTLRFFFHNINFFFINFFFINFFFINFFFINGQKVLFYFNLILPLFTNLKFSIVSTTLNFFFYFFFLKKKIYKFLRKRNTLFHRRVVKGRLKLHNKYFTFFNHYVSHRLLGEICYLNCSVFLLPIFNLVHLYRLIPINFFYKNIYFWQNKFFVDVLKNNNTGQYLCYIF